MLWRMRSLTTMLVQIVVLSKTTLLPDEDLQYAVEIRDQYLSDNRETNDKQNPLYSLTMMNIIFPDIMMFL